MSQSSESSQSKNLCRLGTAAIIVGERLGEEIIKQGEVELGVDVDSGGMKKNCDVTQPGPEQFVSF